MSQDAEKKTTTQQLKILFTNLVSRVSGAFPQFLYISQCVSFSHKFYKTGKTKDGVGGTATLEKGKKSDQRVTISLLFPI